MASTFYNTLREYYAIAGVTFTIMAVPLSYYPELERELRAYLSGSRYLPITDSELGTFEGSA